MMKFRINPYLFHILIVVGLTLVLLTGTISLAQAAPVRQNTGNGETIFKTKCASCHTIGSGRLVGPDLKGVTTRRDTAWLSSWIKEPDKVLASGDATATKLMAEFGVPMPNLGLSDTEVTDLISYFQSVDGTSTQPTQSVSPVLNLPPSPQTAEVLMLKGDPYYGEKLFTGEVPLQNGGTPCIACHTVLGTGTIGGGALGPDQTHVYKRYGREGLAGVLGTLPFPTMQGVFAKRPLTADEQADLLAFFAKADQQGSPRTQLNFQIILAAGAVVAVILLGGMAFFWPRQRMSLAQHLRKYGKL